MFTFQELSACSFAAVRSITVTNEKLQLRDITQYVDKMVYCDNLLYLLSIYNKLEPFCILSNLETENFQETNAYKNKLRS